MSAAATETPRVDGRSLRSYVTRKYAVIGLVRTLAELLRERKSPKARTAEELLTKLAEDRFNLVVLGQFKRGKSSLINAVVGKELLPTAAIPLTSVVTALRYGPQEKVVLRRQAWALPQEVPISSLGDYVTERGNPRNEKQVLSAEVQVPTPFLRRGLFFIDTPGVGSAHEHNTETTYRFLPEADAAIFVTAADSPLTEMEIQFLRRIRTHVRKLFFVLNKTDQLDPTERDEVVQFTQQALLKELDAAEVRLYPISARLGLEAKQREDTDLLASSGLPSLEGALAEFLAEERGQVFLVSILDRAFELADDEESAIALALRAQEASPEERRQRGAELRRRLEALDAEGSALGERLRECHTRWLNDVLEPDLVRFSVAEQERLGEGLEQMARELRRLPGDRFWEQLRRWLLTALRENFERHLKELEPLLNEHTHSIVAAETEQLRKAIDDTARAAAEVMQLPNGSHPADAQIRQDRLLSFGLPRLLESVFPGDPPLVAFLPGPFARPALLKRLQQTVPAEVNGCRQRASGGVNRYLEVWSEQLAAACEEQLSAARQQVQEAVAPGERPSKKAPTVEDQARRLSALRAAMVAERAALLGGDTSGVKGPLAVAQPLAVPLRDSGDTAPVAAAPEPKLALGLRGRGCALCEGVFKVVWDFLAQWQRELATSPAAQRAYVSERGLCPLHTWALGEMVSPRTLCAGYPPLAEAVAAELRRIEPLSTEEAGTAVARLLPGSGGCRACRVRDESEARGVRQLLARLETPGGQAELRRSQGVCLPHLHALLASAASQAVKTFLISEEARHFEELSEDMQAYAVKFDTVRRPLLTPDEEDASHRALTALAGRQGLR